MNHAIIIFGEYRTYETVSKFWNIPDNFDIYISTWNTSSEKRMCSIEYNDKTKKWEGKINPWCTTETLIETYNHDNAKVVDIGNKKPNHQINLEYYQEGINENSFSNINPTQVLVSNSENKLSTNTANMIYHWKQMYVRMKPYWEKYENIYMMRIDSVIHYDYEGNNVIESPSVQNLEEGILYSSSLTDAPTYGHMNDIWFYGKKETIKNWINNLDIKKHYETHVGIAVATKEAIDKGLIKGHKNGQFATSFVRRGMVPVWEACYEKWKQNGYSSQYLPIGLSDIENIANLQYGHDG